MEARRAASASGPTSFLLPRTGSTRRWSEGKTSSGESTYNAATPVPSGAPSSHRGGQTLGRLIAELERITGWHRSTTRPQLLDALERWVGAERAGLSQRQADMDAGTTLAL